MVWLCGLCFIKGGGLMKCQIFENFTQYYIFEEYSPREGVDAL